MWMRGKKTGRNAPNNEKCELLHEAPSERETIGRKCVRNSRQPISPGRFLMPSNTA
ncbi:MAG: hypothetical protein RIS44_1174 [Pseudomonadota bacterium]|jgi:hypothetical protein